MLREWRLDANGQPDKALWARRVADRCVHEMLGMVKGLVADGVVNDAEVVAFRQWIQANPDVTVTWPGDVFAERIVRILADGVIDDDEREELHRMMEDLVGDPDGEGAPESFSTRLPLDNPCPTILFDNRTFVFTGYFACDSRDGCKRRVVERGGRVADTVTGNVHYLVIGEIASHAWMQSAFGRKIEKAVHLRERGKPLAIVSERSWLDAVRYA